MKANNVLCFSCLEDFNKSKSRMKIAVVLSVTLLAIVEVHADKADPCNIDTCKIEDNCRCSSPDNPINISDAHQVRINFL